MNYTLEEIYLLVGKQDKTALLLFKPDSNSYKLYGESIVVLFTYTQDEREELDQLIKNPPFSKTGQIKAKHLGFNLTKEQNIELTKNGINSEDILEISYFIEAPTNTFHSEEERAIKKIEIPMTVRKNGGDLDWIYGFNKKLNTENIGFTPQQRAFYLALKYYYEPEEITQNEALEIFDDSQKMHPEIDYEFLGIKILRKDPVSNEELHRVRLYIIKKKSESFKKLNKYLLQSGSSLKKLAKDNVDQAALMFDKVLRFKERKLNVTGPIPIYLDVDSYLHIYMRHVREMKVNKHFESKDNFQWSEADVLTVMENIIQENNEEIQKFFAENPGSRYSKYGSQSIYFEGDYYTFHIENNGRISTFYKNRKKIQ